MVTRSTKILSVYFQKLQTNLFKRAATKIIQLKPPLIYIDANYY